MSLPVYKSGEVPPHLQTERRLRREEKLKPIGEPKALLHMRTRQQGWISVKLYDRSETVPVKTRNQTPRRPPRNRCRFCGKFIDWDAADQEFHAECLEIAQENEELTRWEQLLERDHRKTIERERERRRIAFAQVSVEEKRELWKQEQSRRQANWGTYSNAVREMLFLLDDLWMLNQRARWLGPHSRAKYYTLKSSVLAKLFEMRCGEAEILTDVPGELETWYQPGDMCWRIPISESSEYLTMTCARTYQKASGKHDYQEYLAIVLEYKRQRWPFHQPLYDLDWFPDSYLVQLDIRHWTQRSDGSYVMGGENTNFDLSFIKDWAKITNRLIAFTGKDPDDVFFDPDPHLYPRQRYDDYYDDYYLDDDWFY
jgi:hypothetical protein